MKKKQRVTRKKTRISYFLFAREIDSAVAREREKSVSMYTFTRQRNGGRRRKKKIRRQIVGVNRYARSAGISTGEMHEPIGSELGRERIVIGPNAKFMPVCSFCLSKLAYAHKDTSHSRVHFDLASRSCTPNSIRRICKSRPGPCSARWTRSWPR